MAAFSGHTSPRSLIIDYAAIIPLARDCHASKWEHLSGIKEVKTTEGNHTRGYIIKMCEQLRRNNYQMFF